MNDKKSGESTKKDKKKNLFKFFNNKLFKQICLVILFTIILFFIVVKNIAPKKVNIKIGEIVPYDIRATKDIVDEEATQNLRSQAIERVQPRYRINPSVQMKIKSDIKDFFDLVKNTKVSNDMSFYRKVSFLKQKSNIKLLNKEYSTILSFDDDFLSSLESSIYDIINQIMSSGIKEEEIDYEKENVEKIFESLEMTKKQREIGTKIINSNLKANKFVDAEATQKIKKEEADKVKQVIIQEYQIIARKGDRIDSNSLKLIKQSGLLKEDEKFDFNIGIGSLIIVILVEILIGLYVYFFDKDVFNSSKLYILGIIFITILAISQGVCTISPYIMPISAAAMLLSILINIRFALIINFILSFLIGLMLGIDESVIAMFIIGGSIGAFSIIKSFQRYNIFFNGLIVGIANVFTIIAYGLIKKVDVVDILFRSGYGVLNGVFCAILTIGTLPLWENVFKILTPIKLLELSNPNQPLLKKLMLEAPGTYHHSVLVANLSEAAAEAIGANPLITRVAAYYHDVGKLKRPYFFSENQFGMDNPHDKLNPTLSTLIITNHTKDGVKLAEKYKLPKEIRDIIIQHHGDTLVAYFYYQARKSENGENVKMQDFRYKCPKPQTREAALIMLADSSEAAVRSIKNPDKGKIEEMVRNVIKGKLEDNQLQECNLTLKDLNTIANSFCTVLLGIFHDRISYPKLDLKEVKGEN